MVNGIPKVRCGKMLCFSSREYVLHQKGLRLNPGVSSYREMAEVGEKNLASNFRELLSVSVDNSEEDGIGQYCECYSRTCQAWIQIPDQPRSSPGDLDWSLSLSLTYF